MKYCCEKFKDLAENTKITWKPSGNLHWYLLREANIEYPNIPTMSEYKLIEYCPFCGKNLGGQN